MTFSPIKRREPPALKCGRLGVQVVIKYFVSTGGIGTPALLMLLVAMGGSSAVGIWIDCSGLWPFDRGPLL